MVAGSLLQSSAFRRTCKLTPLPKFIYSIRYYILMSEENIESTVSRVDEAVLPISKKSCTCVCTSESRCVECYDKECNCA